MVSEPKWICCQIGAREHYALPRMLLRHDRLALLITDAWSDGRLPWRLLRHARASERYHHEISSRNVRAFDWSLFLFELSRRGRKTGWELTLERNNWYQKRALAELTRYQARNPGEQITLFAYSYAAERLFEFAKSVGWTTVLGQIDPGPFEEKIVVDLNRRAGLNATVAPRQYWSAWKRECALADRIVVNSEWSRTALRTENIPEAKLCVVPLAYETSPDAPSFKRSYPSSFSFDRPLRVLFLGQVNLRKGMGVMLEAISRAADLPVEFWIVGDLQIPVSPELSQNPHVRWIGAVPRGSAAKFYRDADVFLLPSFSDGFGMTQLEAQSWNLPVVASACCGSVVKEGVNGYLLPEVTADALLTIINRIVANPHELSAMSGRSSVSDFSVERVFELLSAETMRSGPC